MWRTDISAGGGSVTGGGIKAGAAISAGATGIAVGPGGWHPDALSMLALVVGEVLIAGFLSRHLLG